MQFRGKEIDLDIFDLATMEHFERAEQEIGDAFYQREGEGVSVYLRRVCNTIFSFFDTVCGVGFHQELFGDRVNARVCMDAFLEFCAAVGAQKNDLNTLLDKYTPSRATRRAAPAKPKR